MSHGVRERLERDNTIVAGIRGDIIVGSVRQRGDLRRLRG